LSLEAWDGDEINARSKGKLGIDKFYVRKITITKKELLPPRPAWELAFIHVMWIWSLFFSLSLLFATQFSLDLILIHLHSGLSNVENVNANTHLR
jgi:hypothetical protein